MTITSTAFAERSAAGTPFTWERQLRPALETVSHGTPRVALVGTAGSGKSTGLRHLHDLFLEESRQALFCHDTTESLADVPAEHVLLVDDLHLLSESQLAQLGDRADDPTAALIVARRPWPAVPAVRDIARRLEQHMPAVVLGHVSRSDVLDHLDALELVMADDCVEHILRVTRGMSWLVTAAVQHHDARDCAHDGSHTALDRALAELIVHRLDSADDGLRRMVEQICVTDVGQADTSTDSTGHDWVLQGYAQGLLLRSGEAAPLVRTAVREALPAWRLVDLWTTFPSSLEHRDGLRPMRDARVADALATGADRMLPTRPALARELYDAALQSGADPQTLAPRRAQAAWCVGDLDQASSLIDDAMRTADSDALAPLTSMSAAIWSARAMMTRAQDVYRAVPPNDDITRTNAAIASLGVGDPPIEDADAAPTMPSVVGVSMELLRAGLRQTSASDGGDEALPTLVRAAELYSSAQRHGPLVELPAVIAAIAALNLGRLATAQTVLDDAVTRDHGGTWARPRLLLWSAWVAVQRAQPADARELLERALAASAADPAPRDVFLQHAVQVAIARRYDDASGLEAAWLEARGVLLRVDVDVYLLHPLAELISAAARVGDAARIESHVARALQIVESLGDPPSWSAHVHWAGIQQGILLNSPERLAPHAKALVAASSRSRVAARMAKAGRVWTDVLAGSIDADAIVAAAEGLAEIGLMWDAARLAGHGAARSDDRRVSAQLLACARELHPKDGTRRAAGATAGDDGDGATQATAEQVLSERELEVARLVVQGKTYAEIGESIFISPRTAEHHIAHIRRRLGAGSRSELLARLRQLLGDGSVGAGYSDEPP